MDDEFYIDCVRAFSGAFGEAWEKAARDDELLRQIRTVLYDHGDTTTIVDVEGVERSSPMEEMSSVFELKHDVLEQGDVAEFQRSLKSGIVQLREMISKLLFKRAGEAAESVGNAVNLDRERLTGRTFCDLLERMTFEFDDRGVLQLPIFICNPEQEEHLRKLLEDPAVKLRMDVILRGKWFERYALR